MKQIIGCTTRPWAPARHEVALERIAAAGFTDVAFYEDFDGKVPVRSDSTRCEVAAVRGAAERAGVRPSMLLGRTRLDLGLKKAIDDYRRLIDNAQILGAVWLMDVGTSEESQYETYFKMMQQVAPYAEEAGIGITVKPHGGLTLTPEDLAATCKRVGHRAFGVSFDPGNIPFYTQGKVRPEPVVEELAPLVTTAVIKDFAVRNGAPDVMVTAGDGQVDFHAVLSGLNRRGFRGPIYVECVGSREPVEVDREVVFTLGYVKGILASLKEGVA